MSAQASAILALIWWAGATVWLYTWKNSERGSALAVAVAYFIIGWIYMVVAITA